MPNPHIEENVLDRYAMGTLPGESIAEVEEHLLTCQVCQKRLVDTDEFVTLFRVAAPQVTRPRAIEWKRPSPRQIVSWACATAAAAALLVFLITGERHSIQPTPATLLMQSLRGPEAGSHIASGRPSILVFDLAVPATSADYEIQVVDTLGNEILKRDAEVRDGRLSVLVQKLARGSYWVRVYRKANQDLVAEYGLRAE